MRIHELVDTIPENMDEIYVCHAPDGQCRILSRQGNLYDQHLQLAEAKSIVFDSHWRGANAQEIAAHWPKPQTMGADVAQGDAQNARRLGNLLLGEPERTATSTYTPPGQDPLVEG